MLSVSFRCKYGVSNCNVFDLRNFCRDLSYSTLFSSPLVFEIFNEICTSSTTLIEELRLSSLIKPRDCLDGTCTEQNRFCILIIPAELWCHEEPKNGRRRAVLRVTLSARRENEKKRVFRSRLWWKKRKKRKKFDACNTFRALPFEFHITRWLSTGWCPHVWNGTDSVFQSPRNFGVTDERRSKEWLEIIGSLRNVINVSKKKRRKTWKSVYFSQKFDKKNTSTRVILSRKFYKIHWLNPRETLVSATSWQRRSKE